MDLTPPAGCYENYLQMPYRDPAMTATNNVLDWLVYFDDLNTSALRHQNFAAMAYMQYPILAFHTQCATFGAAGGIKFPQALSDVCLGGKARLVSSSLQWSGSYWL